MVILSTVIVPKLGLQTRVLSSRQFITNGKLQFNTWHTRHVTFIVPVYGLEKLALVQNDRKLESIIELTLRTIRQVMTIVVNRARPVVKGVSQKSSLHQTAHI